MNMALNESIDLQLKYDKQSSTKKLLYIWTELKWVNEKLGRMCDHILPSFFSVSFFLKNMQVMVE